MNRLMIAACREHGACRLRDDAEPPSWRRRRSSPSAVAAARRAARAQAAYRRFGFDAAGMDTAVQPGDNFYEYANGTWAKNTPIPADKSNYGMFTMLDDLSRRAHPRAHRGRRQGPEQPDRRGLCAASWTTAAIEAKGLAPIKPWLDQIRGSTRKAGLAALYAERRPASASARRSAASSARTTRRPTSISCACASPASACPTAIIICRSDAKLAETKANYLDASDQDADPRRRSRTPPRAPRRSSISKPGSPRSAGPGSTAATRPRPTTR